MNEEGEGKTVRFHCIYCGKDIKEKIRLKCAICLEFYLCVECFSVGAEVYPHKSNHPYRVMDSLSFPLLSPDWSAEEELLLLEGIQIFGLNNWSNVSGRVQTKTEAHCIEHYHTFYMNSPCFPLPDMSDVKDKNREELLAMAMDKMQDNNVNKDTHQDPMKLEPSLLSSGMASAPIGEIPKATEQNEVGKRMMDNQGVSYNPKRHEFDVEYDNDAEILLANMAFNETDTDFEREQKIKVIHVYNKRLDERQRRKDFIIERKLHLPDPYYDELDPEEKQIYHASKRFMQYFCKEDYDKFLKSRIEYNRTLEKIKDLKVTQAAGSCGSPSKLVEQKDSGDMEEEGFPVAELLSREDERACAEMKMMPRDFMNVFWTISVGISNGDIKNKSDAYGACNDQLDAMKIDRIYDLVIKKLGYGNRGLP